ncbi:2-amino-4-hydroxy-6-hydroxymethyldihydropteridine diphosphokinase [Vibrio sp. TH_r3]|uniref:2-amino-4-hydroxy-6- hydroxymethyldihydropteridine diphosphokinase n=1 Tax=Vibrio sp. TH_r3 TaxID=3082084 RepID=UPI0029554A62|nr:2-amino-4-hydroxy-6-hydroxymethyldihydropteridine diphosphokinase [Vibrio sp. TH_r3]MDV7104549.1 2-amino-4-hydroxy-6-hydroxymethyldihydropteridine diphosphokinase [Vibrio sp. TH_r3]
MTMVYIGVGTNVEREKHAKAAIEALSSLTHLCRVSSIYECESLGFDSTPFYNFVVELKTTESLSDFSQLMRSIEIKWGRSSTAKKFQDRSLDLDILLFGEEVSLSSPIVPREDIFKYPFVIQPLYDLVPDLVIPMDGRTVKDIWQDMDNLNTLSKIELI